MEIVTTIHFMRKVALYGYISAINRKLITWKHGYRHEQKEGFERRRKG